MTFDELIKQARAKVDAMSQEEKEAMLKQPKPKFKWINGVKVYNSYEDYCNG